ncbi:MULTISPECIES: peptidylprolyl isomerase [Mesorhizobium]|uniref:Peptidylprolyl isomerase n=2 Tax=Mesorhizobium TaxID=68287 RepID=A0ABU5AU31_9HYPH|nr:MULTISPECIES: peptidylprolyl isomerase [Mesorhizobium]MDX8540788.1 peptidylprolyl isomerase [Mesorhizobium abyssinicae]RUW21032.1 peptidylprolyl isomerase [Mesorhizobium sp. M4B.F.Ca.ET.013.02.1.1]RUW65427.1 peptidylprolyl isomerase [Mesorhizobium sp. M4B.F.Ca.ET.049.02.1.2]RVD14961.1 peptidylprolyl isomerase [Mesorhizobium sp. M4B.F.Ca.ET.017.02.2.1]RVD41087.1 peptidylprolyl isomerase [Mesorhizobium sp. M4B.F.Ca.ET.019.03.1.1]
MRKYLFSAGFALLVAATSVSITAMTPPAFASTIKYVVNNVPITTGDIAHRAAFLKLQRKKGDAGQEMIDQTLRMAEARRLGIRITDAQVDAAYQRFATNNKMQLKQLDGIMAQSGVTKEHFKDFIRAQMAWNQALGARYRSGEGGAVTEQDAVRRMLDKGGAKPTAMEYMLQQVIFVVPASERSATLAKRKREADAMRARFNGCDSTRQFAKGLLDVTVRDLGRVLAPQLPADWADQIKATKVGGATATRETERGIEFIGICSSREVSDDKAAQMVFQSEGGNDKDADELSKKYVDELRKKAKIVER